MSPASTTSPYSRTDPPTSPRSSCTGCRPARSARPTAIPEGDGWESVTWAETGEQVKRLAAGLIALGVESEQRVGISSGTRYEWIAADLAVMCAGAATTTVYPSTISDDVSYILADSECRVVFAEDDEQVAKIREHKSELPHLSQVVVFDGTADGDWVIGLDDLAQRGADLLEKTPTASTTPSARSARTRWRP